MTFSSGEFESGTTIPDNFTCEGLNISPQLSWSGAPAETKSYAIIIDDPDVTPAWDHWLIYNIPANVKSLVNARTQASIQSIGGKSLQNSWGKYYYLGPCPPAKQTHTYSFRIYALDVADLSEIGGSSDKIEFVNAINAHKITDGSFTGTFGR
ncbi:MAG: YbhB/YbcL family Raf kinase inhibitor-like protein [Bacteroidia bacterium]|nr:YbhB/YbcL family Raf kinase inhibitor-like protein [Bacteroidia bacterium]NNJ55675.1 YbhB/YbcL family Raf kinase inhibitor-like protein [Bacteroidia bacterium]